MTWREAFLRQARHERTVWRRLNVEKFDIGHQLHFLQMVTEKLAKGFLTAPSSSGPPKFSHKSFVRFLQTLKSMSYLREMLGYTNAESFNAFIDSLLPLAEKIENLAPALAGSTKPNPEYPWKDATTGQIFVPAEFDFPEFDPNKPQLIKLEHLIGSLLKCAE